jgi:hypothetical protein
LVNQYPNSMKKYYILLVLSLFCNFCFSQLTVTSFANNTTLCAGNSTLITASATPVSYNVTSIPNNLIGDYGVNILADPAGVTFVTPITRSAGVNQNDCRWDNIPIGFSFSYYGSSYTSVNVSSNGWINFSASSSTTGFGSALPNATEPNNAIHGVTTNLTFVTSGILEYYTDGLPPNRTFVVSYQNVPFASGGGIATFQIQLHENGNIVEIHTTDCTNATMTKAQGVENAAGTVATVAPSRNNTNWSGSNIANGYRFTPDIINFAWSPSSTLSSSTGKSVTATPTGTTTYTINATNASSGATGSTTVTITVDPASNILAATAGGVAVCQNISVLAGGTNYRDGNCNLIASITPAGATPVNNSVNTCTKLDNGSTKRGTTDLYAARKYDIEPAVNAANATANIKLYYLQSEFDNFNLKAADSGHKLLPTGPSDATGITNLLLRQFHGTGTNPTNYTGASVDFTTATSGFLVSWNATRNWWEITVPINGFSGFYLSSAKAGTLNISLNYFRGAQIDKKHLLSWKVNCTSIQAKFELQRSSDGRDYTTINSLTADKDRCGTPFEFIDENPLQGKNYYRLKFIDVDGKISYSNIVVLTQKMNLIEVISLNPNIITSGNSLLKINAAERESINIVTSDYTGRVIKTQIISLQIGLNQIAIDVNNLASGTYNITCYMAKQKPQTLKLIKQ